MDRRIMFVAAATLVATATAQAEEERKGAYVGATLGQAAIEIEEQGFSFDTDDTAFKVLGGYRVNGYFGVEGSYIDFGDQSEELLGLVEISAEATGFNLAAVGSYPVGERFEVFGQVGYVFWDADTDVTDLVMGGTVSDSESGEDLSFGIGGEFLVNSQFSVRAEWQSFDLEDTDEVTFWSVGGSFRFQ